MNIRPLFIGLLLCLQTEYDVFGNIAQSRDANGHKTAMEYNARHEMVLESCPETALSYYRYDEMGQVLSQTDPVGREMTYTYDPRSRKVEARNGAGEVTGFDYDLNNNQTRKTRPAGRECKPNCVSAMI